MTMEPPPEAMRWGIDACSVCHTPVRLMSSVSCQMRSVTSSQVWMVQMPALATTMSSRPRSTTARVERGLEAVCVAHVGLGRHDPPAERATPSAVSSRPSGVPIWYLTRSSCSHRSMAMMSAPSSASRRQCDCGPAPRRSGDEGDLAVDSSHVSSSSSDLILFSAARRALSDRIRVCGGRARMRPCGWSSYGAGAVGGVVGARLTQAGRDTVLIARGPHLEAMRSGGLTVRSPAGDETVEVRAVASPDEAGVGPGDVVLLAMKSNDTHAALEALAAAVSDPATIAVVCLQNGVANERAALRRFPDVYGISVMCPTAHLEAGVVEAACHPVEGVLDIGRFPVGVDETAEAVAGILSTATFVSQPRPDIMRWKYAKLLLNLGNAVDAAVAPDDDARRLVDLARAEGEACLAAAGIDVVPAAEERARRKGVLNLEGRDRVDRPGGSTWQSLARGTGSSEVDYLNGEIVLLGRLHGVPTPVNELLRRVANELAAARRPPGIRSAAGLLAAL